MENARTSTLTPELLTLGAELERLGHVVVPHGDHICVRLPLLASVRIRLEEGRLRCAPQFGFVGRTAALWGSLGGTSLLAGGMLLTLGVTPVSIAVAVLGVLSAIHDACRVVLTEQCMTRVQMAAAPLPLGARATTIPAAIPPGTPPASPVRAAPPVHERAR